MTDILFLIHDLSTGGAEKVLINLVNNMDRSRFNITVMALFDGGVNRQFLSPDITYKYCFKKSFPGNSHVMKLLTPKQLHSLLIKERYDIEVSYLEGPSARVISGCADDKTKLVSWIHCTVGDKQCASIGFRNFTEAAAAYQKFNKVVFVSKEARQSFQKIIPSINGCVLYNTSDTAKILEKAKEPADEIAQDSKTINLIAVGTLKKSKGYDRLINITEKLVRDGIPVHLYILGQGPMESEIRSAAESKRISDFVTLLGYQTNPYKYLAKADLFVCASYSEGFSTAATEALIVGTPVCTVEVSGMKEMLGENNEYGFVTQNSEQALYNGIKQLAENPDLLWHYKEKAKARGKDFSTEKTVKAAEDMLIYL